jgi:flavin-binding protein dodecin
LERPLAANRTRVVTAARTRPGTQLAALLASLRPTGCSIRKLSRGEDMSIAKIIEISAESTKGFDDAIQSGLKKAAETVQNIESAWIKDHVVVADNGKIVRYRVHMHVTFKVR